MDMTRFGSVTIGILAVLLAAVTVVALQSLPTASVPSFTADYYGLSHKHPQASDELSRGKRLVQGRFWRDRQGRQRQEDWEVGVQGSKSHQRVFIDDPTLGVSYKLKPEARVALRSMRAAAHGNIPNPPTEPSLTSPGAREITKTELGTQTIEGFSCNGYKSCYLGRCDETWWCPALQYVARMRRTYDSGAVDEMVWSNFKVGVAPHPQLFVVPSDYTVIDRTSPK